MQQVSSNYFYCYSARLRRAISEGGIKWVERGINTTSGYPYWKFERSKELDTILNSQKKEVR